MNKSPARFARARYLKLRGYGSFPSTGAIKQSRMFGHFLHYAIV